MNNVKEEIRRPVAEPAPRPANATAAVDPAARPATEPAARPANDPALKSANQPQPRPMDAAPKPNDPVLNPNDPGPKPNDVGAKPAREGEIGNGPLLPESFVQDLRTRWDRIQTGFVDEPRAAVKQADELVVSAIKRLSDGFSEARNHLERQWDRGDQVNTEDLRIALTRYRTFFQKLITV
jgi:hypothetical protein